VCCGGGGGGGGGKRLEEKKQITNAYDGASQPASERRPRSRERVRMFLCVSHNLLPSPKCATLGQWWFIVGPFGRWCSRADGNDISIRVRRRGARRPAGDRRGGDIIGCWGVRTPRMGDSLRWIDFFESTWKNQCRKIDFLKRSTYLPIYLSGPPQEVISRVRDLLHTNC